MTASYKLIVKSRCGNCTKVKDMIKKKGLSDDIVVIDGKSVEGMTLTSLYDCANLETPLLIIEDGDITNIHSDFRAVEREIELLQNRKNRLS